MLLIKLLSEFSSAALEAGDFSSLAPTEKYCYLEKLVKPLKFYGILLYYWWLVLYIQLNLDCMSKQFGLVYR